MTISFERDYNRKDNKGLYIRFGYDNGDDEIFLIRLEDNWLFWYESQNGERICEAAEDDIAGKTNMSRIENWLIQQNPDAEIEPFHEKR